MTCVDSDNVAWVIIYKGELPNRIPQGPKPAQTVPNTGSTSTLVKSARSYGCDCKKPRSVVLNCLAKKLKGSLKSLKPDPTLNSTELIQSRLQSSKVPLKQGSPAQ